MAGFKVSAANTTEEAAKTTQAAPAMLHRRMMEAFINNEVFLPVPMARKDTPALRQRSNCFSAIQTCFINPF
jgi:hypothetical protein